MSVIILQIIAFLVFIVMIIAVVYAWRHLILSNSMTSSDGYVSSSSHEDLVGKTGRSLSVLRPGGIVEINGRRLDARAQGEYIERDARIVVLGIDSAQLIVDDIAAAEIDSEKS